MMSQFRNILLHHFQSQIPAAVMTMEPSTSLVGAHCRQVFADYATPMTLCYVVISVSTG